MFKNLKKHRNLHIIGLTGQSGAGKTTAAEVFIKKGFTVIDCDKITREVYKSGSPCNRAIADIFGDEILLPDGEIDRKKLGGVVFADKSKLELLNQTVYPFINASIAEKISENVKSAENTETSNFIMLDAPTLFESGIYEECEKIVAVVADEDLRLSRIKSRDNTDEKAVLNRFNSQHTEDFFRANCEYIIENNGSTKELIYKAELTADLIWREFQSNLRKPIKEDRRPFGGWLNNSTTQTSGDRLDGFSEVT